MFTWLRRRRRGCHRPVHEFGSFPNLERVGNGSLLGFQPLQVPLIAPVHPVIGVSSPIIVIGTDQSHGSVVLQAGL
jgi:hypothetical protein